MRWFVVSFIIALVLSGAGWIVTSYPFDIYAKVIFWLIVGIFLNAQLFHLIHLVHVRDGA